MDRETARQEIRSRISCKDYLTKSKAGYIVARFAGAEPGATEPGH